MRRDARMSLRRERCSLRSPAVELRPTQSWDRLRRNVAHGLGPTVDTDSTFTARPVVQHRAGFFVFVSSLLLILRLDLKIELLRYRQIPDQSSRLCIAVKAK